MSPRPNNRKPGQKAKNPIRTIARLFATLRAEKLRVIAAILLTFICIVASVVAPRLLGRATDTIFAGMIGKNMQPGQSKADVIRQLAESGKGQMAKMLQSVDVVPGAGINYSLLGKLLLTVVLLYLVSAVLNWLSGLCTRTAVQNVSYDLRQRVQAKINRLPLSALNGAARGDILSRVTNDVDNVSQSLQQVVNQLFHSIFLLLGTLTMMFMLSWQLTIVALLIVPAGLVIIFIIMKRAQPYFQRQWKATGNVQSTVEEAFSGHEIVLTFNLRDQFRRKFAGHNKELFESAFGANWRSGLSQPVTTMINNLAFVAVCVVGALMVLDGRMSVGGVQAFIQYSRQLQTPLGQLSQMLSTVQSAGASAERIFEFLDSAEESHEEAASRPQIGKCGAHIEFRNVSFSYEEGVPVIKNLSLDVAPGQTVAIVGQTGAGKTTLVNLLMRFYEIDSGQILIDGVDIRQMTRAQVRERCAMVLQDTWLFKGSIRDNIAFGNAAATDEQIVEAARATQVDRIIRQLPEGYDTEVSDEGGSLSQGEKQLVTIARAFLRHSDVLILDEATSSVDTRTEVLVQQAMDRLQEGNTSFVIAHRLSTIRDASTIIVMEDGDVVEQGTHTELLAAGGAYARLYQSQFEGASA
ncbi:ABC transporter ATP-binding protein/permease [Winkia sp. ACRQY]|uniref:ABC transporter ATP-binding protein n=1 Tax=Winkia sp. ACRQY TaxID=2918182 RepID=UPI001EF1A654|nr:ABC transporter ATP-binding protein [Winkia sp. ACRQY]MCG7303108.1 ABC transporter ATP-binding protein/permease [Winkia sp. ACRQY]